MPPSIGSVACDLLREIVPGSSPDRGPRTRVPESVDASKVSRDLLDLAAIVETTHAVNPHIKYLIDELIAQHDPPRGGLVRWAMHARTLQDDELGAVLHGASTVMWAIFQGEYDGDTGVAVQKLRAAAGWLNDKILGHRATKPDGDGPTDLSPARHSPDFRSAHWYGADYAFTGNQAAVVKILWEAWENGTPEVSDAHLLTKAESDCKRLAGVFRHAKTGKQHDAWDKMIVSGTTKGTRRLNAPPKLNIDPKST